MLFSKKGRLKKLFKTSFNFFWSTSNSVLKDPSIIKFFSRLTLITPSMKGMPFKLADTLFIKIKLLSALKLKLESLTLILSKIIFKSLAYPLTL